MALFKFTKNIINGKFIELFNYGKHNRDFTYVDDIVAGIVKLIKNHQKIKFHIKSLILVCLVKSKNLKNI